MTKEGKLELIMEYQISNLTIKNFAKQKNIGYSTLCKYLNEFKTGKLKDIKESLWVELNNSELQKNNQITISVNNHKLEFDNHYLPDIIKALL